MPRRTDSAVKVCRRHKVVRGGLRFCQADCPTNNVRHGHKIVRVGHYIWRPARRTESESGGLRRCRRRGQLCVRKCPRRTLTWRGPNLSAADKCPPWQPP